MRSLLDQIDYLWALVRANMRGYAADRTKLFVMSFFMLVQDAMFFALWIIFFSSISEVKGWKLEELSRMFGLISCAIGLSLFFFNGARTIAYRVQEGTLDALIARPRNVLPALLLSSSSPASLGDIFYGPLLWAALGNMSWGEWGLMIFLTVNAALMFTACTIAIFSTSFWLKGNTKFPEQLFEMLIILSSGIVHGQPLLVKIVMFTILPAAFMSYLPIELVRNFAWDSFALILGSTVFYGWLSVVLFKAGLRRYVNSMS